MQKLELLAPAKNKEIAKIAIDYGADAVYIGANSFGARKNAQNTLEDIKEVVDYAHKFWAKVYCTINTILTDEELEQAKELIFQLYDIGVDSIIVQDMGIFQFTIEGKLPPIRIHASTQCDNSTLEKVQFFEKLGIKRVILARELSLEQIKEICDNTNIEIETFVHGALCVSYSGQCYLSQAIGGRSANRGECAQPCRKTYTLIDNEGNIIAQNKHLLSLKDFNASKKLKNLVENGVCSFKIEGRLKDEIYVKNIVAYYRQELDKLGEKISCGKINYDFTPDPKKSFNRGYCEYFLEKRGEIFNFDTPKSVGEKIGKVSKIGKNYFEIPNNKLHAQDGLYFKNGGCLVNKIDGNKVYPNKMNGIKIGTEIYRNFDCEFEKTLKNSTTKRQIQIDIEINQNSLKATDESGIKASVDFDYEELANNNEKMKSTIEKQLKKCGDSDFICNKVCFNTKELAFLPVSKINQLRRDLFETLMQKRIAQYKRRQPKELSHTEFPIKELDYRANIHNQSAKKFYEACGCVVNEMSFESGNCSKEKCIMKTKHCLKYAFNMCKSDKKLFLIDDKNQRYKLEFDCKHCEMHIYKD